MRRRKNQGIGYGMKFWGAFKSKTDAKRKEKQVHGFIQPRNIKGQRRFVVMSERKNPIRRKKRNQVRYLGGSEGWEARHEGIRVTAGTAKEALRQLRVQLKLEKEEKQERRPGRKRNSYIPGSNPMDLVVMGANPTHKEIVVHPGQTITLKVNPDASAAEEIREGFVGRFPDKVTILHEPHMADGEYAKLGALMGLSYKPSHGGQVEAVGWYKGAERIPLLEAAKKLLALMEAPTLVSDDTGRRIYFVAGNQDISPTLDESKHQHLEDDLWELGKARHVVYRERKRFDKFELINYVHKWGEETGEAPRLLYNAKQKRLLLDGGDYQIRPEGITN